MSPVSNVHGEEQPEGLNEIAAAMITASEEHPLHEEGDRGIIMLSRPLGNDRYEAGTAMFGFDDGADALTMMLGHMEAAFAMRGMKVSVIPMDTPIGEG